MQQKLNMESTRSQREAEPMGREHEDEEPGLTGSRGQSQRPPTIMWTSPVGPTTSVEQPTAPDQPTPEPGDSSHQGGPGVTPLLLLLLRRHPNGSRRPLGSGPLSSLLVSGLPSVVRRANVRRYPRGSMPSGGRGGGGRQRREKREGRGGGEEELCSCSWRGRRGGGRRAGAGEKERARRRRRRRWRRGRVAGVAGEWEGNWRRWSQPWHGMGE